LAGHFKVKSNKSSSMGTYLVHGPAQENWMKNCQKIMPVLASGKWFWPSIFAHMMLRVVKG